MSSVCFYFQVHQPYRLRRFSYFDSSRELNYFDEEANAIVFRKVAEKSYLPTNKVLLDLIKRFRGRFRFAFSLSGIVVEQMQRYAPDVLASFQELVATGSVEILGETYHHTLASIYDEHEFCEQVMRHDELMKFIFGAEPKVFRNTELIYDDRIGEMVASLRYRGIIAEGADDILNGRTPNKVYKNPYSGLPILAKNYALSDDIAFRFSNVNWKGYPLTPEKFAYSLHSVTDSAHVVNLFMDYETFGEHQWSSSGIFSFLNEMPSAVLSDRRWNFLTPSEVINCYAPVEALPYKRLTSWADKNRDLSAWLGNRIQRAALQEIVALAPHIRKIDDPHITTVWRRLQTSDHFYYMCTSGSEDGDVHAYFSPYQSPYDAFIRYMNVLKDFKWWVFQRSAEMGDVDQNRGVLRIHY
ncbi:MAG: glycoside hydrolase family 57 protein [Bdellovibrionota bacterium]|jgi:alpha-amylase